VTTWNFAEIIGIRKLESLGYGMGPSDTSGTAEARVVKFCTQVQNISYAGLRITNHPKKGVVWVT